MKMKKNTQKKREFLTELKISLSVFFSFTNVSMGLEQ